MPASFENIESQLIRAGYPPTDAQGAALRHYVEHLLEWNAKVNLISRKDEEQVWLHHILHSLAPLTMKLLPERGVYIDLGSGGGLPGIPLAIMLSSSTFVLVDSIAKKMRAVEDMLAKLELGNVRCITGRIEDMPELKASADVVLARGVTRLLSLARWTWPLLRPKGARMLLAWKGGDIRGELGESKQHAKLESVATHDIFIEGEPYFTTEEKKIVEIRFS